jgi:hypothetical protein
MYGKKAVRSDDASSIYQEHGALTVQELIEHTCEALV